MMCNKRLRASHVTVQQALLGTLPGLVFALMPEPTGVVDSCLGPPALPSEHKTLDGLASAGMPDLSRLQALLCSSRLVWEFVQSGGLVVG